MHGWKIDGLLFYNLIKRLQFNFQGLDNNNNSQVEKQ